MHDMAFEFRLEGGKKFHIGRIEGDLGKATILAAPSFCRVPGLRKYFSDDAHATWHIQPLRRDLLGGMLSRDTLCNPPPVSATVPGVACVYVLASSIRDDTRIDVYLADDDGDGTKPSTLADWLAIVGQVKDDLNREAILRVRLAGRPESYAAFGANGVLAASDLEVQVRPRAVQWQGED
jgi:hypothetical protein